MGRGEVARRARRALFAALVEHACGLGVGGIVSYVNAHDRRSIEFARRAGLEEVESS